MSTTDPANLPNPFKGFHIRTEQRSPTDELRIQIAQELRGVLDELLATSAPVEELERTRAIINQAVSLLRSRPHSHNYEGPAEGSLAPMNSFLDRSPIIGAINPLSVPMRMDIEGDGEVAQLLSVTRLLRPLTKDRQVACTVVLLRRISTKF